MDASTWNARYASRPELEWGAGPNAWVAAQALGNRPRRALDLAVELADTVRRPVSTLDGPRDALDAVVRISRA